MQSAAKEKGIKLGFNEGVDDEFRNKVNEYAAFLLDGPYFLPAHKRAAKRFKQILKTENIDDIQAVFPEFKNALLKHHETNLGILKTEMDNISELLKQQQGWFSWIINTLFGSCLGWNANAAMYTDPDMINPTKANIQAFVNGEIEPLGKPIELEKNKVYSKEELQERFKDVFKNKAIEQGFETTLGNLYNMDEKNIKGDFKIRVQDVRPFVELDEAFDKNLRKDDNGNYYVDFDIKEVMNSKIEIQFANMMNTYSRRVKPDGTIVLYINSMFKSSTEDTSKILQKGLVHEIIEQAVCSALSKKGLLASYEQAMAYWKQGSKDAINLKAWFEAQVDTKVALYSGFLGFSMDDVADQYEKSGISARNIEFLFENKYIQNKDDASLSLADTYKTVSAAKQDVEQIELALFSNKQSEFSA